MAIAAVKLVAKVVHIAIITGINHTTMVD